MTLGCDVGTYGPSSNAGQAWLGDGSSAWQMTEPRTNATGLLKDGILVSNSIRARVPHAALVALCTVVATQLIAASAAIAATPPPTFDAAASGSQPSSTADRGQTYLIYNLNPLRADKMTVDDKLDTPSGNAGKPDKVGPTTGDVQAPARGSCTRSSPQGCLTNLQNARRQLDDFVRGYSAPDAMTVDKIAAGYLDKELEMYAPKAFVADKNTSITDEVLTYRKFLTARILDPKSQANLDITTLTDKYRSEKISENRQNGQLTIDEATAAIIGLKEGDLKASISTAIEQLKTALKQLDDASVTSVAKKADDVASTWVGIYKTKQAEAFYTVVNAPCTPEGFSRHIYTVKLVRGQDTKWTQTVTCLPEFQVGAMYFVDFLSRNTYSLVTPPGGGPAVITRQQNDVNQGSIAAVVHWCPGDQGGNAWCFSFAGSSNSNANGGLSLFLGGGYLFGHRTFGLHTGLKVGQTTVLQNPYAEGQAVPAGTTFTRTQTTVGPFIGVTINTK